MNPYKYLREQASLSQRELALEANCSQNTILSVENGTAARPPHRLTRALLVYGPWLPLSLPDPPSGPDHLYLAPEGDLGPSERLELDWMTWKLVKRDSNSLSVPTARLRTVLSPHPPFPTNLTFSWPYLRRQVMSLSVAGASKLFLLQLSLLQDLERSGHNASRIAGILEGWGIPTINIDFDPANYGILTRR